MSHPYTFDNQTTEPEHEQHCGECGRTWYGPDAVQCDECYLAGGAPLPCFQCNGAGRWREVKNGRKRVVVSECAECDACYPLEVVRTYRLGMLLEMVASATKSCSAEEVGKVLLGKARPILRRVV